MNLIDANRSNGATIGRAALGMRLLGDPGRLRLVLALHAAPGNGMTEDQLAAAVPLTGATLNANLRALRYAGLVASKRRGNVLYYQARDRELSAIASLLIGDVPRGRALDQPASFDADKPRRRRRGRPAGDNGDRTAQILSAAMDRMSQVGFDGTTVGAVAELAGVTRPAVNYHFGSKSVLYWTVVAEVKQTFLTAAAKVGRQPREMAMSARLKNFVEATMNGDGRWTGAAMMSNMVIDCTIHPELGDEGAKMVDLVRSFLSAIVFCEEGFDESVTEPAAVAELVLALLLGLGVYGRLVGTERQTSRIFGTLLDLLERNVATP